MNTALAINRTPEIIAAEINSIKEQARIQILCNSIEIGRRLIEAKDMLPHGEWGKWLETSVDYSQSTANNLMRIADEYGTEQFALFGADAKSQALGKLGYTQAVALLAIPSAEREEFIEENGVENMSTRELQQAIKERDQARKEKEAADKKLQDAQKIADQKTEETKKLQEQLQQDKERHEQDIKNLQSSIEETKKELDQAKAAGNDDEIKRLQTELDEADAQLASANDEIKELNKQLQEKPIDVPAVIEKIPEDIEEELKRLRKQNKSAAVLKYTVHFNNLVKGFQDLLGSLVEIQESDPAEHEKYKGATLKLIKGMSENL